MSLEYYIRNQDQLTGSYGTPYNAVLEIVFSDVQSSNGQPGGLHTLVYTGIGDETSFQDDLLINASVFSVSRDGLEYTIVDEFSATLKKEVTFDSTTGTITYAPGLPGMVEGEDNIVLYLSDGETPVDVTEPVTLQEAKNWLKVEVDDDDDIIEMCITAARQACEGYTGLSFVNRTITAVLKNDLGNIRLPYGPVNSITSMYDVDGGTVDYTATGVTTKRILSPTSCYLKVTYTAGYGALPRYLKTGVLEQMAWIYSHRGDEAATEISPVAKIALKPYRSIV